MQAELFRRRRSGSSRAWLSCLRTCKEGACASALLRPSVPSPCSTSPPGCAAHAAPPKQNRRQSAGLPVPGSSRRSSPPVSVILMRSPHTGAVGCAQCAVKHARRLRP